MNKILLTLSLFLFLASSVVAQESDTTIYNVAETMPYPLFNRCKDQKSDNERWNEDSLRRCNENYLLSILAQNIRYPEAARQKNIEGTVVASFVVEKNGKMSNLKIIKDIGEGCGDEALRVLKALDELGLKWQPATLEDKTVRMRHALPLRFRLEEPIPFYVSDSGDSIYTILDTEANFDGGVDSLYRFILTRLEYPTAMLDSCKTGVIEMALMIGGNGSVDMVNQIDFNNLGYDFQWKALQLANRTNGMWTPAVYQEKPVTSTIPLRVLFKSNKPACKAANERFDQAMILSNDGALQLESEKPEEAIAKFTEALALSPNNTELLYYRGSAYLQLNRRDEACADYNKIKELLGITWFESIRKVVCGW